MNTLLKQRQPLDYIPAEIVCAADYERLAPTFMVPSHFAYVASGSGNETTLQRNRNRLEEFPLASRVLRDFGDACTETTLLGHTLKHPFLLAPVAHQKLAHPEGELATLAGAAAMDTPFITSTLAHTDMEHLAAAEDVTKWFQLYFQPQREVTLDLVKRAERLGYQALVVTVDVPVNGLRFRAQKASFTMPSDFIEANLANYQLVPAREISPQQSVVFDGVMPDAPVWEDIEWLRENTRLPILIKGVTHPLDAEQAKKMGLDGVIVSNHGGRSLDGLPATIDLLPPIRQQVGAEFTVLMDGGIRSGGDIYKSLISGANAVLIGRLQVYALAVAGALGVAHMLRCLTTELEVTMALAGCTDIKQLTFQDI